MKAIDVSHFHNRDLPERKPGEHLWIVAAMFRAPVSDTLMIDAESLLSINGPGCYYCEEPHTAELAAKPCEGSTSR